MKKLSLLLFMLILLFSLGIRAQEPLFRNYSVQQYRAQTQNWDIVQLPGGSMAFANNGGMMIYDGNSWNIYPISNYTTVRALCYDQARRRIYAGATAELGYYSLNADNYHLEYHSLIDNIPAADRQFGEIWNICKYVDERQQSCVLFQSKSHIFIYTPSETIKSIKTVGRIETMGLYNNKVVVATRRNICVVEHGRLRPLAGTELDGHTVVRSLVTFHGRLLVATQQNGLLVYDGKRLTPFDPSLQSTLIDAQIFSLEVSGDIVAVGTVRRGLFLKDCKNNVLQNLSVENGLQNNTILSLFVSNSGNIWMGLDNGLSCAVMSLPFRNLVSRQYNIGTGYVAYANGSNLYLGTNQGLYVRQLPLTQTIPQPRPMPVAGITSQVWHISNVLGDVLCCSDRGLFSVSGTTARQIDGVDGSWCAIPLRKHPGYVLATDYLGACLLRKEGATLQFVRRLKVNVVTGGNIFEDNDGSIWMSNWMQGIYRMKLSADMTSLNVVQRFDKGNGLLVNENNLVCKVAGRLYVSSVDGFYYYDARTKRLVHDDRLSHVFNTYGSSLKLVEVEGGDIWAQKPGYLALAHKRRGGYVVDSISYRVLDADMKMGIGSLSPLDSRQTLINGNTGFFIASNNVKRNKYTYDLLIRRIVSTNRGDTTVYQSFTTTSKVPEIEIHHSLNSIRIEYVQPEYRSENAVSYECMLVNYDKQWTSTASTSKEYTQLAKGTYVFRVRSFNLLDGTTKEAAIKIIILPAWYETWWAWLIYIIGGLCAFFLFVRWLKQRAERQLRAERIENDRQMNEQLTRLEVERTKRRMEMAEAKSDQLQAELKHKASELASSTMNLIQHNDMLLQLDDDMRDLSEAVRRDEKKAMLTQKVQNIRSLLQSQLNDDEGWAQFEENFNVVYDDFMVNLMREFPNLKKADRKLCAYLKMGLSSKEMASLLNMSVRSIETARYRLRKKLNLDQGDNLTNFIQTFGTK